MILCPPRERLVDFLEGRLPEPDSRELEQHVETCPSCPQTLAELCGPAEAPEPTEPTSVPPVVTNPDAVIPVVPGCHLNGKFELGGMGAVYFGTDSALGRPVAVKVLLYRYAANPEMVARFEVEARICAQLQHPGIVPVHQVGRLADGRPFYVMKLVQGDTLSSRLKGRPTPTTDMLPHFRLVCEALAYAHDHNVLHRDLKPANIMLGKYGEVLLMDWGLAKKLGESDPVSPQEPVSRTIDVGDGPTPTRPGLAMGTLAYMPPEQAAGCGADIDKRSDVFSLGAILCTLLTGQPPYVGPTEGYVLGLALHADLTDAYARLDACGADAELVALARRCLSGRREDRPADAGVVAMAIAEHLARVEERLQQAEVERKAAEVRAVEERKRRRLTVALAIVGLAAVLLGSAFWIDRENRHARVRQSVEDKFNQVDLALAKGNSGEADQPLKDIQSSLHELPADDLRERLRVARKTRP